MNNVNILGSKIVDHKFFFPVIIILALLLYIPLLNSTPFGDDYVYIFNNGHILGSPHPFVFWKYGAEQFKSWPLSFSFIWAQYRVFVDNFYAYRIVNLLLHIINVFIFYKIIKDSYPKVSKYLVPLFLIHPMVVENIYWIFQFKTLISLTFLLLSIYQLQRFKKNNKSKNYSLSLLFFLCSLLAKSTAILFPVSLLLYLNPFKKKVYILAIIPFFILSTILGTESLKGVTSFKGEKAKIQNFHNDYFKKKQDYLSNNKVSLATKDLTKVKTHYIQYFDLKKYKDTTMAYLKSLISLDAIFIKITIIASSLIFYLKGTFGLTINRIIYPDLDLSTPISYILPFLFFISFFLLLKIKKEYSVFILISILLFLPISGLIYVPYMQYSYVADHWFYAALPFVLFIILLVTKDWLGSRALEFVCLSLLILFSIQTFSYTNRLSNTNVYFQNELKEHNYRSQISHEYLIEIQKREKKYKKALFLSIDLYKYATSKRDLILENILELSKKTNHLDIYSRFLQKKSILYFINGSVSQARDILIKIPKQYRFNNFSFLLNLYDHARKKIYSKHLDMLNHILKQ